MINVAASGAKPWYHLGAQAGHSFKWNFFIENQQVCLREYSHLCRGCRKILGWGSFEEEAKESEFVLMNTIWSVSRTPLNGNSFFHCLWMTIKDRPLRNGSETYVNSCEMQVIRRKICQCSPLGRFLVQHGRTEISNVATISRQRYYIGSLHVGAKMSDLDYKKFISACTILWPCVVTVIGSVNPIYQVDEMFVKAGFGDEVWMSELITLLCSQGFKAKVLLPMSITIWQVEFSEKKPAGEFCITQHCEDSNEFRVHLLKRAFWPDHYDLLNSLDSTKVTQ